MTQDPAPFTAATTASFEDSLIPMLIADDARQYIDANRAACLLFRLDRGEVLKLTIDDLTPPEQRADTQALWDAFLRDGAQSGTIELRMPDGARVVLDYSATANVEPGRHLSLLALPHPDEERPRSSEERASVLSAREREVLTLIAMGEQGAAIALKLGVSRATVETHVRHCLSKLGANNRAHAITLGLQLNEIAIRLNPPPGGTRSRAQPA